MPTMTTLAPNATCSEIGILPSLIPPTSNRLQSAKNLLSKPRAGVFLFCEIRGVSRPRVDAREEPIHLVLAYPIVGLAFQIPASHGRV